MSDLLALNGSNSILEKAHVRDGVIRIEEKMLLLYLWARARHIGPQREEYIGRQLWFLPCHR
jgi:hypothetical protein